MPWNSQHILCTGIHPSSLQQLDFVKGRITMKGTLNSWWMIIHARQVLHQVSNASINPFSFLFEPGHPTCSSQICFRRVYVSCVCCVILGVTGFDVWSFCGNTYGTHLQQLPDIPCAVVVPAGWAKGKGWAGRIKRWGGKRGPMTHGSKHHRTPRVAVGSKVGQVEFCEWGMVTSQNQASFF